MRVNGLEVSFIKADLTALDVCAIVNAANTQMLMGGGVAGAIRKKGGHSIEDEVRALAPVKVGEAVITGAGALPSRFVIHAATMEMDFKTDYAVVRRCVESVFDAAEKKGIDEVAFPLLGCGVGRLDAGIVAKIIAQEIFKYSFREGCVKKAYVVYHADKDEAAVKKAEKYLAHIMSKAFIGPFLTVDAVAFDDASRPQKVVLVKRTNPPFGWALPGGFVDWNETVEAAAAREFMEEVGLRLESQRQFRVYSAPNRDERFHTVSVVFIGCAKGDPHAGSDAKDARWFELNALPDDIAFDHRQIIDDAIKYSSV